MIVSQSSCVVRPVPCVRALSFESSGQRIQDHTRSTLKDLKLPLVSLQRGTSDLPEIAFSGCFEGLFHPEIASESNLDQGSHLVTWFSATVRQENSGRLSGI